MTKVFIDGKEGTTGLRIFDRLSLRSDLELLTLPERERKNPVLRKELLNQGHCPFVFAPRVPGYKDTHSGVWRFPSCCVP